MVGFKQEEIVKMDLEEMGNEELQKIVREKLIGAMVNNGNKQRVVRVGEVRSYVSHGFEYVASLPDGEAIVKVPP